jgi:hypothetical protein
MSLATSTDNGLTWHVEGPIITGRDAPDPSRNTGEGDCTAVNGGDGYYYAYCWRNTNGGTIVARAPVANPGPGNWKKYFNGAWSEPGLGGDASKLDGVETPAARWVPAGLSVNLGSRGGLVFSADHVKFTVGISEPLVIGDKNVSWNRPTDPHDLQAYWSLLDAKTGGNQLSGYEWNLFYLDLQPNEGFNKRYLVVRPIEVSQLHRPDEPRVATMLGHWHNAKAHEHWSTGAAVPGNYTDFKLEAQSGYLMTMADAKRPTVEIEDCASQQGGHRDHILMQKSEACESHGYTRQRTVGWVFSAPLPDTQPLYRCFSEAEKSHFAANSEDCDHAGKMEALLGYDLKQ